MWLLLALVGCPAPEPLPPELPVEAPNAALSTRLMQRTSAYRASPDPVSLEALRAAVDEAMAVQSPEPALAAALGDALANGMLRPDLGLPMLEAAGAAATEDALSDAILRADLTRWVRERAPAELEVDPFHPTVQVLAHRAQVDPTVRSSDVSDAYKAGLLIDEVVMRSLYEADLPIPGMAAITEVIAVLVPGWDVEVAVARAALPSDPDPLAANGTLPCDGGRRRLDRYSDDNDRFALRQVGEGLDLVPPIRLATLGVQLDPPGGGRILIGVDMDRVDGRLHWIGCTDLARCMALAAAADTMVELQRAGLPAEEVERQVRDRHRDALVRGR
jgi:hypothetical protein